jgi:8-oxo-dGTP diphosphatase
VSGQEVELCVDVGVGKGKARVWTCDLTEAISASTLPIAAECVVRSARLVAACVLIDADGRVLIAQRPEGKTMAACGNFPAAKSRRASARTNRHREMQEELGITIKEACLAPFVFASHAYENFHLLMPLFLCRRWDGIPHPHEGQTVTWVRPRDLALFPDRYPMPPQTFPSSPCCGICSNHLPPWPA